MKNKLLLFLLCIAGMAANGQTFNKTHSMKLRNFYSKCIIPELTPSDPTMFWTASTYAGLKQNILLTKANSYGEPLKTILIDSTADDHRIHETLDSSILLATFNNPDLHVFKYNKNLTRIWSLSIPLQKDNYNITDNSVDIEVKEEDTSEYYYILSGAPSPISGYANVDASFSVVKLTKNGQLIWHKIYGPTLRFADSATNIWDVPRSLTIMDSLLVISGTRFESYTVGHSHLTNQFLFYMTINTSGNIVTKYHKLVTAGPNPSNPEVAWDRNLGQLVTTYREQNRGWFWDPAVTYGIGFMTLTPSLSPTAGKFYWDSCTVYGNSITVCPDSDYVIGAYGEYCNAISGTSIKNPVYLKISSNSFLPIFYKRYNIHKNGYNIGFHRDDISGNHYMTPYVDYLNGQPLRARLIKGDVNGQVCGDSSYTINDLDFSPLPRQLEYLWRSNNTVHNLNSLDSNVVLSRDSCTPSSPPQWYKHSNTQLTETATIYPTIALGFSEINCRLVLSEDAVINIDGFTSLGQQTINTSYKATVGETVVNIPTTKLSPGVNVIRIYKGDQLLKIEKVIY